MYDTMESQFDMDLHLKSSSTVWVFGYGSLLWRPGFEYHSKKIGFIKGYTRRFWQGNSSHRGTESAPGRVATLIVEQNSEVWGVAFELKGDQQIRDAFEHLGVRECFLGGYDTKIVPFTTREDLDEEGNKLILPALVFMAVPSNDQYLGEASIAEITDQVINSKGHKGHNVEYVIKMADFIRKYIPEEKDGHLFELDLAIRNKLKTLNIPLWTLMGENSDPEGPNEQILYENRNIPGRTKDINKNIPIENNNNSNVESTAETMQGKGRHSSESWSSHDVPEMCAKETNQKMAMKVQS